VIEEKEKTKQKGSESGNVIYLYRVIINDCPIAVGVENPHKFGMYR
jgi:hypothetical protein